MNQPITGVLGCFPRGLEGFDEVVVLFLAHQGRPRQFFFVHQERFFSLLLPLGRLTSVLLQILLQLFLTGDRLNHALFGFADILFHFPDNLFDHPFRVFDAVDQVVEVGADYIADPLEHACHGVLLLCN